MAESTGKVLEGVFAIKKPASLSSAQVLRDLQHTFKDSKTFAPLRAQDRQNQDVHRSKRRRIDKENVFKMGHGGTLDPMATGVLIVGIGRGTKHLQNFLECTKAYRTVVLFGKSTDTYDVAGKVVASGEASHITEELVRQKIKDKFQGSIQQVPPIYSALKIDGMKAYEYARTGKKLPRELAARFVTISDIKLAEWHPSGEHNYRWPIEQASEEAKTMFQSLTQAPHSAGNSDSKVDDEQASQEDEKARQGQSSDTAEPSQEPPQSKSKIKHNNLSKDETAALHTHTVSELSEKGADGPAAVIEMTVSSGFYVRSFAHDLGLACGSYGTMADLARTRQGDYTTEEFASDHLIPAIEYLETQQSEEIWAPKIRKILDEWVTKNPSSVSQGGGRDGATAHNHRNNDGQGYRSNRGSKSFTSHRKFGWGSDGRSEPQKRRNSSSPE